MTTWPPTVGSRGQLNEPHPWAGHEGTVLTYELFQDDLAIVVVLDSPAGHTVGVVDAEDFMVFP